MIRRRECHWVAENSHVIIGMVFTDARGLSQDVSIARQALHGWSEEIEGCIPII